MGAAYGASHRRVLCAVCYVSCTIPDIPDGQQIFTGTIQGRRGSVSMRARGTHVGDWSTCEWEFVTETAT
jgi:hypothetical protein